MTPDGGEPWRQELASLRERLGRLEKEQREAIETLRWQITEIEKQAVAKSGIPAPEPVTSYAPKSIIPETSVGVPVRNVLRESAPLAPPPLPPGPPKLAPIHGREREKEGQFEMQLGRVWLVRFGIVLLLTGLVLLGNFAYKNWIRDLPNGVRLLGLFACSGLLVEAGRRLAANPALKRFGEVLFGGGLAFFYYCTFAAHHVNRLKVIDSPVVASILLFFSASLIGAVSWFRNSRTIAVIGIVLASYSTMLQPIGWLSCVSNMLLAGAGLFLMRRPGWSAPGVAAMIGSYAAFFGWQLLGASGGGSGDPAMIWFLPPVWIMFSLPGVFGRFRETMSDRASAWFAGTNNALFFLLFIGLWVDRFDKQECWMVCGVFGLLLVALGVLGRRMSQIAGGVNLSQGLGLVSLALILKLDGYHLALALAGESLMLAFAFARFRGRSELAFSWLAAVAATLMIVKSGLPAPMVADSSIPVWSAGLAALLLAGASVVLRKGTDHCEGKQSGGPRLVTGIVFFLSVVSALVGWNLRLPQPWPLPVTMGISLTLAAASLLVDRQRKMPEVIVGSLLFLFVAFCSLLFSKELEGILAAGALAIGSAWLWHWSERREVTGERDPLDLKNSPDFFGWAYAVFSVVAIRVAVHHAHLDDLAEVLWLGLAGVVLLAFAVFTRTARLAPCAAALGLLALGRLIDSGFGLKNPPLLIAAFAVGMLGVLWSGQKRNALSNPLMIATAVIIRLTLFGALWMFWVAFWPQHWGDGLALMAIALIVAAFFLKKPMAPEVWGLLVIGTFWLVIQSHGPWRMIGDGTWRGLGVVSGLVALISLSKFPRSETEKQIIEGLFAGVACVVVALWSTQMLVWRHDWNAVAVLWTVLGFVMVSAGLWLKLRPLRLSGFVLLTIAVGKVFTVDVWDFNAFMRVVAFIVLGIALILLGLFYNRFVPAMKKLLEEEKPEEAEPS